MAQTQAITQFEEDILEGLSRPNKYLPSKYFYDAKGDELFQQIMQMEEYYLTNKELEIFETNKQAILESIDDGLPFRIIELGAGDGTKTKILLNHFLKNKIDFTYTPVDISSNVLACLEQNLEHELSMGLKFDPYTGDYFDALTEVATRPHRDVVFFLGSNIGNFPTGGDERFLMKLSDFLNPDDLLFIGADLKKDPNRILRAYNDTQGITRAFNFNLLDRINRELDANFDLKQFSHYPYYNPQTGECRSYLISKIKQEIRIGRNAILFEPWEAIFMEVSKKYDAFHLPELANSSGFVQQSIFSDVDHWFADVLWKKL